jgi:integrase
MYNSIFAKEFEHYYALRHSVLSVSAAKHEKCYLQRFDAFLSDRITEKCELPEIVINDWVKTVNGKSSSVENEIIVIRQFLKYLQFLGVNVYLPIIPKVHDDYIPYIFSDDELDLIFESADSIVQKNSKADPNLVIEFPVIIRLLYSCGLRIGEAVQLKRSDVDLIQGTLRMLNTKGDKHRLVPMSVVMTEILQRYCMAMGQLEVSDLWLFPSSLHDGHISVHSVKGRFDMILKANRIQQDNRKKHERGPCLHCLRHVFAFKSFEQSERAGRHLDDAIPYLSIYLGHERLDETSKYLKFSSDLFPDAMEAYGTYMEEILPEVDYET